MSKWYKEMTKTTEGQGAVNTAVDAWTKFSVYLMGDRTASALDEMMLKSVLLAIKYLDGYKAFPRSANNVFDELPSQISVQMMYDNEKGNGDNWWYIVSLHAEWLIRICHTPRRFLNGNAGTKELELMKSWLVCDNPAEKAKRKEALLCLLDCITEDAHEMKDLKNFIDVFVSGGIEPKSMDERVGLIRGFGNDEYWIPKTFNQYSFLNGEILLSRLSADNISKLFQEIYREMSKVDEYTYVIDFSSIDNFLMRDAECIHIKSLILNELLAGEYSTQAYFSFYESRKMFKVFFDYLAPLDYKIDEWVKDSYCKSTEQIKEEIKGFLY